MSIQITITTFIPVYKVLQNNFLILSFILFYFICIKNKAMVFFFVVYVLLLNLEIFQNNNSGNPDCWTLCTTSYGRYVDSDSVTLPLIYFICFAQVQDVGLHKMQLFRMQLIFRSFDIILNENCTKQKSSAKPGSFSNLTVYHLSDPGGKNKGRYLPKLAQRHSSSETSVLLPAFLLKLRYLPVCFLER